MTTPVWVLKSEDEKKGAPKGYASDKASQRNYPQYTHGSDDFSVIEDKANAIVRRLDKRNAL